MTDRPSAGPDDEHTRPFDDGDVTEQRSTGAAATSLRLREMGSSRVIMLEPRTRQVAVGRSGRCEVLLDDPAVSHRHARLARCASGWTLVDAGSTNGTFVNDRAAATPTLLHAGDVVRFGPDLSFLVLRLTALGLHACNSKFHARETLEVRRGIQVP